MPEISYEDLRLINHVLAEYLLDKRRVDGYDDLKAVEQRVNVLLNDAAMPDRVITPPQPTTLGQGSIPVETPEWAKDTHNEPWGSTE